MKRLWVKLVGECDYLICPDRDNAKAVYVAFYIILEVPIGDRTQKWHFGIHCLNALLSRNKPIGAGPTILGLMYARGHWRRSRFGLESACPRFQICQAAIRFVRDRVRRFSRGRRSAALLGLD